MIRWIVADRLATGPALSVDLPGAFRLDVRNLVDAAGNTPEEIATLLDQGVTALNSGKTVVVVCDFGVSRSNAVAAGLLSLWKNQPLDDALTQVMDATGESEIKIEMIDIIRKITGASEQPGPASTVLLTGASGFIGSHLQPLFDPAALWAPARRELDLTAAPVEIARALARENISCVLHLAHPRIYTNTGALGAALNMQKALMDAALSVGARFVLVSSASVFAGSPSSAPIQPDAPTSPKSIEGIIKTLQEDLLKMTVAARGLTGQIVRLPQVYGPGGLRPRLLEVFARAIAQGDPVRPHLFDNGPADLALLHVADAARALQMIAAQGREDIYHIAAPDVLPPVQIATLIADHLGCDLHVAETRITGQADRIRLDGSALQAEFDWTPRHRFETALPALLQGLGLPANAAKGS